MNVRNGIPCNRFGFPLRENQIAGAACEALLKAAANENQLSIAIETIDRCSKSQIKVAPRLEPSTEIRPECKKFYDQAAASGQADEVIKVARISGYFREHYPGAIKWAEKQKLQSPVITGLTKSHTHF